MNEIENGLHPLQRLAIAYAPSNVRAAFALLLQFDAKLRGIVANSSEILIGQMKIAWWRDAIMAAHEKRPKGEPLLNRLAALQTHDILPELELLLTAWEELLLAEDGLEATARFADNRGKAIFGGFMRLVGRGDQVDRLGAEWALADLTGAAEHPTEIAPLPRRRVLRPLTILALSVRNVSGPRLIWHALTGR